MSEKPTMDNKKAEIKEYMEDNNIEYNKSDTKKELLDKIEDNEPKEKIQKVVVKVKNIRRQKIAGIDPMEEKQVKPERAEKLVKTGDFIKL